MPMTESRPRTDDECWRTLLERMGVPGHPGIYVLGAFARHVTFYSQQVRALNLVDALCNTGRVAQGGSVAVVGAGLAGLTAAAGAVRRGLHVHLLEKDGDPRDSMGRMPLQINSAERWIDPFIYDWPLTGEDHVADEAPSAALPVVSWKAEDAYAVRDQVLDGFQAVVDAARNADGEPIEFHHRSVTEKDLARAEDGRWLLEVDGAGRTVAVDAVLLAVGFGVEPESETRFRYWTNDGLGGSQANPKTYLVTGAGDGGLTDVMRLCIAEFRHRKVLAAFRNATAAGSRLQEAVRNGGTDLYRAFLDEAAEIDSPDTEKALKGRGTRVFLTGSPEGVFGRSAGGSILNRLIVAWLLRKKRFALVNAAYAGRASEQGRYRVEFSPWDDRPCERIEVLSFRDGDLQPVDEPLPGLFDDVIVRHGPGVPVPAERRRRRPVEEHFPTLWKASSRHEQWWRDLPHWDDWTREPAWAPDAFTDPPPLDPPLRGDPLYVVVEQKAVTGTKVHSMVTATLRKAQMRGIADSVVSLDVRDAFSTPQKLGRAVRILCRASVAVFDVTPTSPAAAPGDGAATAGDGRAAPPTAPRELLSPESMVLLGIRSVARRSLTVVTSRFQGGDNQEPSPHEAPFRVPLLPFLLRDVSVYGWRQQDPFMDRLREAFNAGRERAERLGSIYRDLPAYDEVRRLGPDPAHFQEHGPDDRVLFLIPFDPDYRDPHGNWLMARVGVISSQAERMSIIQSPSPERTPAKLYAAIRRTQLCVVDWTRRSPNVFYELGVRMAVTPRPPVNVIHCTDPWASGEPAGMYALFQPMVYDHDDDAAESAFEDRLAARKRALPSADSESGWPLDGALVSPDFVYRQMEEAIAPTNEDWNVPVWRELATAAEQIIGRDPDRDPEFRGIFGGNEAFKNRAMESARDRLLAAWYYLDQLYGLSQQLDEEDTVVPLDEPPWSDWFDIGTVLVRELAQDARELQGNDAGQKTRYRRVRQTIQRAMDLAEERSTDDAS